MVFESSYQQNSLAPRCRLIASSMRNKMEWFDCSSIKAVLELGSERCETVWSLSIVKNNLK